MKKKKGKIIRLILDELQHAIRKFKHSEAFDVVIHMLLFVKSLICKFSLAYYHQPYKFPHSSGIHSFKRIRELTCDEGILLFSYFSVSAPIKRLTSINLHQDWPSLKAFCNIQKDGSLGSAIYCVNCHNFAFPHLSTQ